MWGVNILLKALSICVNSFQNLKKIITLWRWVIVIAISLFSTRKHLFGIFYKLWSFASEFRENLEEMFPRYNIHIEAWPITQQCVVPVFVLTYSNKDCWMRIFVATTENHESIISMSHDYVSEVTIKTGDTIDLNMFNTLLCM